MRFVASSFRVMTLGEAVRRLERNALPRRALVVTFDDGYADNAAVALPVLKRCGVVATFFVSTGFLNGGRMWNDSVIECIRASPRQSVDLGSFGLKQLPLSGRSERRSVIDLLLPKLKYLGIDDRQEAVARLQQLTGVERLPTDLMMTSEQVQTLHQAGMEIGAHTVRHPILTTLNPDEAAHEILEGKKTLEAIVQAPVDTIAYPNGKPGHDYDESHVALVQRLGFRAAVSTAPGVAQFGSDVFQLPRFTPWGTSMAVWAARLAANQLVTDFDHVKSAVVD